MRVFPAAVQAADAPAPFLIPLQAELCYVRFCSSSATGNMRRLFAVVRSQGEAWQQDRDLRMQDGWSDHARFMNALAAEGFVVVGGPLAGSEDTLLIVAAQNEEEIRHRLAADPWGKDMLTISRLAPWQVLLGEGRLAGGEPN